MVEHPRSKIIHIWGPAENAKATSLGSLPELETFIQVLPRESTVFGQEERNAPLRRVVFNKTDRDRPSASSNLMPTFSQGARKKDQSPMHTLHLQLIRPSSITIQREGPSCRNESSALSCTWVYLYIQLVTYLSRCR